MSQEIDTEHCLSRERWASYFGSSNSGCKLLGQNKHFRSWGKLFVVIIGNPCNSTLRHKFKSGNVETDLFYSGLASRHLIGFSGCSELPLNFVNNDYKNVAADSIRLVFFCIQLVVMAHAKPKSCAV